MLKLNDPSLLRDRAYIGGVWTAAANRKAVHNPANGALIAEVADVGVAGARAAIDAAAKAFPAWSAKTARERSAILIEWNRLMLDNADDLARILTAEMGKPFAEARGEILYGASFVEWFAQEARRVYGDVIPGHLADKRILVLKQPIGVAAAITPWNFPNAMIARKVAPALAAGCTFVSRPAELTPLSALAMAALGERAGIPAGVFNVVTSADASGVGQEFCANPKVRKISFTGSTRVGSILMRQSGRRDQEAQPRTRRQRAVHRLRRRRSRPGGRGRADRQVPQRRSDLRLRQPHLRAARRLRRVRRQAGGGGRPS